MTESLTIPPTTTPQPPCMCNMSDCTMYVLYMYNEFMFPPTAPLVNVVVVVVGVVSIGFIIVAVVVITVCLLIVGKEYKHKKNSFGEDKNYTVATTAFCVVISTAPIDHVYWKQPIIEIRFVLNHLNVQICWLTSFHSLLTEMLN